MSSYRKTMRQVREEMLVISEAKYELYHKDFSTAMQHAYKMAKKLHGITVDPKEIDDKVASGPRKPSEGKTNSYRLEGDKGSIQVQVYNKGGPKPFELNFYKEEVELDESVIDKVKEIASKKSAAKIDGVMVDSFSASAISQIYDKVSDANKKKMEKLPITKLANLAFKMMQKNDYVPEEVDLDEGTKQVLAHGGKGQYKAVRDGGITKIMYKGKVVGTADFDSGADSFFVSMKGVKGQKSFDDAQAMVDYFAKNKIKEEVELDEKLDQDDKPAVNKVVKMLNKASKAHAGQAKDLEKSVNEAEDFKPHKMYDPKTGKEYDAKTMEDHLKYKKMGYSHEKPKVEESGEINEFVPAILGVAARAALPAVARMGAMAAKGAARAAGGLARGAASAAGNLVAPVAKIAVPAVAGAMMNKKKEKEKEVDESAASDARRAIALDPSTKQKFSKNVSATDDDIKSADKNVMMQMRKAVSLRGNKVEFMDKKKVQIPQKIAQAVLDKYNSQKKPADKEKFQSKVSKSYKSMLTALKERNEINNKNNSLHELKSLVREMKGKNNG